MNEFERVKAVVFVLGLLVGSFVIGQGRVTFQKETHDFGLINERDEYAEYTFLFVNDGDQAVRVSNVKASCGCTTPYWTKEEILPGDSGRIAVRYNTINRPGPFRKTLQVTSNGLQSLVTLSINGQVRPAPRTVETDLPAKYGALRMKYRSFNFGTVTTEKKISKSFEVYNDSDSTLRFITTETPDHINLLLVPDELEARKRGEVLISYSPEIKNDLGYQSDPVSIMTSEEEGGEKKLYVIATIEEYFPPMDEEEFADKPRLFIAEKLFNFKKVLQGDTARSEFFLHNQGMDTLKIRKTQTNCECVFSELEKDMLLPGEQAVLKVGFVTAGRLGQQFKNVTIFSNDPMRPTQMVTVKATVEIRE